jgi:hypothetical protein
MSDDLLDKFVHWCTEERSRAAQQLMLLESDKMATGERMPNGVLTDTTPQSIAQAQRSLAELDALLAGRADR